MASQGSRRGIRKDPLPSPVFLGKGSVLIASLWVLAFFSVLSLGLSSLVHRQIQWVERIQERLAGHYLVKAAVAVQAVREETDETPYDTLQELQTPEEKALGLARFSYTREDEERRINVNTASKEILSRLPGFTEGLADAVLRSPLRPFHLKEELLSVDGMTQEAFDQFQDFVTVYSDGKINILTAPAEVLTALGMEAPLAESILEFRRGPDGEAGTDDDGIIEDAGSVVRVLQEEVGLSQAEEALLANLVGQGLLTTQGQAFKLLVAVSFLQRSAGHYEVFTKAGRVRQWMQR